MAKFKVTDEVIYKGKHYLVHEVNGNKVKISDWEGDERTVGVNDPDLKALNACAVRSRNAVVAKALNACARNAGRVVSNGIGDCYSDGVYFLEEAYKVAGTPAKAKGLVRRARESVSYVAKYDYADDGDKATMSKCLADIDKAASSPTEDTIKEARWTCEKARAKADGGSPRRTFWNACGTARNASGHKVKVTIKSITDKGIQTFEKIVDVDDLESWMRSAGLGGEYQHVLKQLTAMGVNEVSLPAMSKVIIADV